MVFQRVPFLLIQVNSAAISESELRGCSKCAGGLDKAQAKSEDSAVSQQRGCPTEASRSCRTSGQCVFASWPARRSLKIRTSAAGAGAKAYSQISEAERCAACCRRCLGTMLLYRPMTPADHMLASEGERGPQAPTL